MPEAQTLTNPAGQLAALVSQLYDLAGNSQVPPAQQQSLLIQAHDLRGDLVTLVSQQFTQNTAAYQSVMKNLDAVTSSLNQAQQDITKAIGVVNGLGQLAQSIDSLIKEGAQFAAMA
jgi:hypothetical protein